MMYINGEWLSTSDTFDITNPATGEVIGAMADAKAEDAVHAIKMAHQAFQSWSKTTAYERSNYLYQAYQLMLERKSELAQLMTAEQGKPLKAAMFEVQYAADFLLWFAEEAKRNYGETIPSARADQRFIVSQMPIGVVAAITPWNYPISMLTRKLAPALAAGCTVVLKPAESTPLCAKAVFDIFHDIGLPQGVINLLPTQNPAPIGDVFCTHPQVKKVTFTGSTAVGKHLATLAAPFLKRMSMELGGNAPFIVFEDAHPEHAAKGVSLVKFLNSGQACISPNRIFVHRNIADQFIETLQQRINKMVVGNGQDANVSVGPLINRVAMEKMESLVADAQNLGAQLISGGKRLTEQPLDKGFFFAPTLLTHVTHEMAVYQQEIFGPIASVIIFDDEQAVVDAANDTDYGLAAYVYTENLARALRVQEQLQFGIIGINDINPTSAAAPFGGMKESGLGREGAREGLAEYLETKLTGIKV